MAVVLNDLLGISTPSRQARGNERVEFPSFDEFSASRNEVGALRGSNFGYDANYREELSNGYQQNDRAYQARSGRSEYGQDFVSRENENNFQSQNGRSDFSQNYKSEYEARQNYSQRDEVRSQNYAQDGRFSYSAPQNKFPNRESDREYYGSKRVSSSASTDNFHEDVQAHNQRGDFNSCLYSVRDELSSVSDTQLQDDLFDRLAFVSPLANKQQMRTPTRGIAAESIARGTKKASRLTFKGKVILAVYIALAVLITTLVAINASGFNGTGQNASAGNNVSYTETATEVETQANSTSAVVLNSSQDVKYGYVETQFNYAQNSNWFDRFCDNIGKLFS